MAENDVFQQAAVSAGEQAVCGNFRGHDSALLSFVIPGWCVAPDPESRDSQVRNCAP
jgi:hypothetical protein